MKKIPRLLKISFFIMSDNNKKESQPKKVANLQKMGVILLLTLNNIGPTTFFGFEKYDTGKSARDAFQVKGPEIGPDADGLSSWSDARLRGKFDTLQPGRVHSMHQGHYINPNGYNFVSWAANGVKVQMGSNLDL